MRRFLLGFLLGVASVLAVLAGIGHYLDVDDPLAKADAIVAISGDTGARTQTAVRLWKQGYAPVLIFSGASQDPQSVASAELIGDGGSAPTEGNAVKVAGLTSARKLRTAILVTRPYHQRRASLLFEREFERRGGLSFRNHPAEDRRPQLARAHEIGDLHGVL